MCLNENLSPEAGGMLGEGVKEGRLGGENERGGVGEE